MEMKFPVLEISGISRFIWMIFCCFTFINGIQAQENKNCNDADLEVHVAEISRDR